MTIAPQTYYRWLACPVRPTELEEAYLVNQIVDIYRKNKCVYGVRKMWRELKRREERVARCTVYRLMRQMGLKGATRGRSFTTTTVVDDTAARQEWGWAPAYGLQRAFDEYLVPNIHQRYQPAL